MTTASAVDRALRETKLAIKRDDEDPQHPGVRGHLQAAYVQLHAVKSLCYLTALHEERRTS